MPRYYKEQIKAALEQTRGMKFLAAQALGCSHLTIDAWLRRCPDLEEWRRTMDGAVTDTAELKLYEKLLAGEPWAVQFQLRTKGKDRGYGESTVVTGPDGKPIEVHIDALDEIVRRIAGIASRSGEAEDTPQLEAPANRTATP